MNGPRKRFTWRLLRLSILSAVLAILVALMDRLKVLPPQLDAPLALVPVVPLVAFFVGFADWLDSLDELQRRIHLEAMVFQFAATGILVMAYGMLARIGSVPDYRATIVFPWLWLAMFVFWSGGIFLVQRKYE
jgi:hypothetical protein